MPRKNVKIVIQGRDDASRAFRKVEKSAGRSLRKISGMLRSGMVAAVAYGAYRMVSRAVGDLGAVYMAQADAVAKLNGVIRATGKAAGWSAGQIALMAAQMQRASTYGDEDIINAGAILATFKQIQGREYRQALQAIVDLSAAMGQDLKSSAVQVGKALNDPMKGVSALQRVGVSFTETQKENIRLMVEQGRVAEAQKIILDELKGEFGGVAEAMADTPAGKIKQVANRWGDMKEKIAAAVIETDAFKTAMNWAEKAVDGIAWAIENAGDIWAAMMTDLRLSWTTFWENTKHYFTVRLPEWTRWAADTIGKIFLAMAKDVAALFQNIGKNIGESVRGSIRGLQGKGWDFNWTDVMEGVQGPPDIQGPTLTDRNQTDEERRLEAKLERILLRIGKRSQKDKIGDPDAGRRSGGPGANIAGNRKPPTAQLYEARFMQSAPGIQPAQKTAKATEDIAKKAGEQVALLRTIADRLDFSAGLSAAVI